MSPRPPAPEGQGPLMEHVADRVAAIRRRELTDLQLKLFPDWPDDRRGAPNPVIRSAIFGVVRRGRRARVTDLPVAGPAGWNITLTGWRLDQHDCDVWLEVYHLARNGKPGDPVRFTMHAMLKRLGYASLGSRYYAWLQQRLRQLVQTTIQL